MAEKQAGAVVTVAVLFARADSVYKRLGLDVWDAERDARLWPGGCPVVAHPPCRAWGRLRHLAKPRADERDLARFAVAQVRHWGGVLEHPEASALWQDMGLPRPGRGRDAWGGWTLAVAQSWWGHRAAKRTWLYIVGVTPGDLPQMPLVLGAAPSRVDLLGKAEREATPEGFGRWLAELAARCRTKKA